MKNRGLLLGILGVMLFGACNNPFGTPENSPSKTGFGRVTILIAGEETGRTLWPSTDSLHYTYTFTQDNITKQPNSRNGDTFTLEPGSYKVTVDAYLNSTDNNKVATGSKDFTIVAGSNTQEVTVTLNPVDMNTGKGKFYYTVTYPADASLTITLEKWPVQTNTNKLATAEGTSDSNNNTKTKTETVENLDAGSYLLTVKVTKGEGGYRKAGYVAAVHIYPSLTTKYENTFTEYDLLPNAVILKGSVGTVGNEKITGLTSNNYYYVVVGENSNKTTRYVTKDGTLTKDGDDLGKIDKLTGTEIKGLTNGKTYEVHAVKAFNVGGNGEISQKIQYWDYKEESKNKDPTKATSFTAGTLSLPEIEENDIEQFYGIDLGFKDINKKWEIMKFSNITKQINNWDDWTKEEEGSRCSGKFDTTLVNSNDATAQFKPDIDNKKVGIYQYPDKEELKPYYAPEWIAGTSHIYAPIAEGSTDFLIIERDNSGPTGDLYLFTVKVTKATEE